MASSRHQHFENVGSVARQKQPLPAFDLSFVPPAKAAQKDVVELAVVRHRAASGFQIDRRAVFAATAATFSVAAALAKAPVCSRLTAVKRRNARAARRDRTAVGRQCQTQAQLRSALVSPLRGHARFVDLRAATTACCGVGKRGVPLRFPR